MSLRDDFEKEWPWNDFTRNSEGGYVHLRVEDSWRAYQAATERAVRIVREEWVADYDDYRNRVKAILRRLKDES